MIAPEIPADEAQRLAMLQATKLLDSPPEERFDRITRIARRLFGVPIALVTLVDSNRQWFKSNQGLLATETSREISFCGHAILGNQLLIVENAQQDPRFFDNPLVTESPGIRFYAGHPLTGSDGSRLGTLCIISTEPRTLLPDDQAVLHALATMVESELGALDRATTDAITGLANLRGFLEIGDYLRRLAKRLRHPLRVLLLHVEPPASAERTKIVAADEQTLIRRMTAELLSSFADSDLVARIGPRDFAVLQSDSAQKPVWDESLLDACVRRLTTGANATTIGQSIEYDAVRHASLEELVSEAEYFLKQKRLHAAVS